MARSRGQLVDAVSDIDFEFLQLVDLVLDMRHQPDQEKSPIPDASGRSIWGAGVSIAVLESALLHVRNLIDFFDTAASRDITVQDYVGKWSPPRSEALKRLRRHRSALDKHLSHLTWTRVTERQKNGGENPAWDVGSLALDVLGVFTEFVKHLKTIDAEAGAWFNGTLAAASIKLRGVWPEEVPEPSPSSPLAVYARSLIDPK